MTVTIWTHRAPRESFAPYPAYTDDHASEAIFSMLEVELEEFKRGRLCEVRLVDDGKSVAESRAQLDAESEAADRSEAWLREMGG